MIAPRFVVLGLLACTPFISAGCGDDDEASSFETPSAVVASFRGEDITNRDLDRLIDLVSMHTPGYARNFGPPNYPACLGEADSASARRSCKRAYHSMRARALNTLIRSRWLVLEAQRQGLVDGESAAQKAAAAELEPNVLQVSLANQYEPELRQHLPVTNEQVVAYANGNPDVFLESERRLIEAVHASSRASARQALKELHSGSPWPEVIDRHAAKPRTLTWNGHKLVRENNAPDDAFGRAIFTAPIGRITGPIGTFNGWFVFRVLKVQRPPSGRLTPSGRRAIKNTIRNVVFDQAIYDRYAKATTCAADYEIPEVPGCLPAKKHAVLFGP